MESSTFFIFFLVQSEARREEDITGLKKAKKDDKTDSQRGIVGRGYRKTFLAINTWLGVEPWAWLLRKIDSLTYSPFPRLQSY